MRELDLQKAKTMDKSKQKDDAKNAKPKSILESFEYIVELAEDSNLDNNFLEKADKHIKYDSNASGTSGYVCGQKRR